MYNLLWIGTEQHMYTSLCAVNDIVFGRMQFPAYVCIYCEYASSIKMSVFWYEKFIETS